MTEQFCCFDLNVSLSTGFTLVQPELFKIGFTLVQPNNQGLEIWIATLILGLQYCTNFSHCFWKFHPQTNDLQLNDDLKCNGHKNIRAIVSNHFKPLYQTDLILLDYFTLLAFCLFHRAVDGRMAHVYSDITGIIDCHKWYRYIYIFPDFNDRFLGEICYSDYEVTSDNVAGSLIFHSYKQWPPTLDKDNEKCGFSEEISKGL